MMSILRRLNSELKYFSFKPLPWRHKTAAALLSVLPRLSSLQIWTFQADLSCSVLGQSSCFDWVKSQQPGEEHWAMFTKNVNVFCRTLMLKRNSKLLGFSFFILEVTAKFFYLFSYYCCCWLYAAGITAFVWDIVETGAVCVYCLQALI